MDPNRPPDFLNTIQHYLAASTIGHSTLRNQGAKGVIQAARDYLAVLDLSRFRLVSDQSSYLEVLNSITKELQAALPLGARHWGAARKSINLFMRETCYNRFISDEFNLARLEPWMEIPLDSLVAAELHDRPGGDILDPWPGLIRLTATTSTAYQTFARILAAETGETLPALDMRLWLYATKTHRGASGSTEISK